ncbi:MAG TPA: hypothetical protein VGX48_11895 [Pyrinomonadaceae bacterium]|jgi:hypothetical protein|nr:hypothetical protein [Pyrinomonadaceae bacterium]
MRPRLGLLLLLLVVLSPPRPATSRGLSAAEAEAFTPPPLAPLPEDEALRGAYLDAYRILRGENPCSAFYGGAAASLAVLNRMVGAVRKEALEEAGVGMRMSGEVTYYKDTRTGAQFRLFGNMTLNSRGIFYDRTRFRAPRGRGDPVLLKSDVRQMRVVVLLHELAHLVEGRDGRWLIPNDGGDGRQSLLNTRAVMERCGSHVKSLTGGPADSEALTAPAP